MRKSQYKINKYPTSLLNVIFFFERKILNVSLFIYLFCFKKIT